MDTEEAPDTIRVNTMLQALDAYLADPAVDAHRRRVVAADVRQAFLQLPGLALAECDGRFVRQPLKKLGNSKRGLNIRSNVRALIAWAVLSLPAQARRTMVNPEFRELLSRSGLSNQDKAKLTRFFRFLSGQEKAPADIGDKDVDAYMDHVARLGTVDDPKLHRSQLISTWNGRISVVEGWPSTRLSKPTKITALKAPKLQDLGETLAAGIEKCFATLKSSGLSSDETARGRGRFGRLRPVEGEPKPTREPLKESTAVSYERYVRRAARLVSAELRIPYSSMTLRSLVTPKNVEIALELIDEELRNIGCGERSLNIMGSALHTVARNYLCLENHELEEIHWLVKQLSQPKAKLTQKNVERLRALVQVKRHELYRLPAALINGALTAIKRGKVSQKRLVDAKVGSAIAILLNIPLRKSNLTALRLGVHVFMPKGSGEEGRLRLPSSMVKNAQEIDRPIPADLAALLLTYINEILPLLRSNDNSNALFPGQDDNSTAASTRFGTLLSDRIEEHLQIEMNPHLFRHFAAIAYLEDNPGEYEVVRLLLGNRDLQIIKDYYTGLEKDAAVRKVDLSLAKHKRNAGLSPKNMLIVEHGDSRKPRFRRRHTL